VSLVIYKIGIWLDESQVLPLVTFETSQFHC